MEEVPRACSNTLAKREEAKGYRRRRHCLIGVLCGMPNSHPLYCQYPIFCVSTCFAIIFVSCLARVASVVEHHFGVFCFSYFLFSFPVHGYRSMRYMGGLGEWFVSKPWLALRLDRETTTTTSTTMTKGRSSTDTCEFL